MKIVSAILFALLCLDTARAASTTSGRIRRNTDKEKPKFDPELDLKLELDDNCPVFTRNPDGDEDLSQRMIDATLPCGTYAGRGCNYPVIKPNVDYRDNDGDIDVYIVNLDSPGVLLRNDLGDSKTLDIHKDQLFLNYTLVSTNSSDNVWY